MPTYEYKCAACGDVFEVKQKFSDEPLTIHEDCGGSVERIIFAPALQFKGSGWYVTDYARAGSSKDAPSKDAAGKEPAAKDSSSTASKNGEPASTPSAKSDKPASTPSSTETKK